MRAWSVVLLNTAGKSAEYNQPETAHWAHGKRQAGHCSLLAHWDRIGYLDEAPPLGSGLPKLAQTLNEPAVPMRVERYGG